MSVHGTAIITVDGVELQSVPGTVRFNPGLGTSKPRMGPRGFVGGSFVPSMSELDCDVVPVDGFDPATLCEGKEVSVQVADVEMGGGYVVPRMVVIEAPNFTDGEASKWTLKLAGEKAERL